jgi:hypothetical protein
MVPAAILRISGVRSPMISWGNGHDQSSARLDTRRSTQSGSSPYRRWSPGGRRLDTQRRPRSRPRRKRPRRVKAVANHGRERSSRARCRSQLRMISVRKYGLDSPTGGADDQWATLGVRAVSDHAEAKPRPRLSKRDRKMIIGWGALAAALLAIFAVWDRIFPVDPADLARSRRRRHGRRKCRSRDRSTHVRRRGSGDP